MNRPISPLEAILLGAIGGATFAIGAALVAAVLFNTKPRRHSATAVRWGDAVRDMTIAPGKFHVYAKERPFHVQPETNFPAGTQRRQRRRNGTAERASDGRHA